MFASWSPQMSRFRPTPVWIRLQSCDPMIFRGPFWWSIIADSLTFDPFDWKFCNFRFETDCMKPRLLNAFRPRVTWTKNKTMFMIYIVVLKVVVWFGHCPLYLRLNPFTVTIHLIYHANHLITALQFTVLTQKIKRTSEIIKQIILAFQLQRQTVECSYSSDLSKGIIGNVHVVISKIKSSMSYDSCAKGLIFA